VCCSEEARVILRATGGRRHKEDPRPQMPSYQQPLITLIMQDGPQAGQRFLFNEDSISIGRMEDNDVVLDDPLVSRYHAFLSRGDDHFVIEDLGSANGTFVNNVKLDTSHALHDGDVIGLGDVLLVFQTSEAHDGQIAYSPSSAMPMQSDQSLPLWPTAVDVGLFLIFAGLIVATFWFAFARPKALPRVSITSPPEGTRLKLGEKVFVLSVASDRKGIVQVELWVNNVLYHSVVSPTPQGQPLLSVQQSWKPAVVGRYDLKVKAYNAAGLIGESETVVVEVVLTPAGRGPTTRTRPTATPAATRISTIPTPPTATATPSPTPTAMPTCVSDAAFVADVTVPDGAVFKPGDRIDKVWRLRNSGTCPWGEGYSWVFMAGDQMGAPKTQAVPATDPGDTADIRVSMYAPDVSGTYRSLWRMKDPGDRFLGPRVSVVIWVQIPTTSTPTPAPTPTLPPPEISFRAGKRTLKPGDCTSLYWDVEHVREVYLGKTGVVGHDRKTVCPDKTTTYELFVITDEETIVKTITIIVERPQDIPLAVEMILPGRTAVNQPFNLTVEATNGIGLSEIWWTGEFTGDSELDRTHSFDCAGKKSCQKTWVLSTTRAGSLTFVANARDVVGKVAYEDPAALPRYSITVSPY
jgi:pSer/pThr/pTyr-binding forkhead associated (FHA) protein